MGDMLLCERVSVYFVTHPETVPPQSLAASRIARIDVAQQQHHAVSVQLMRLPLLPRKTARRSTIIGSRSPLMEVENHCAAALLPLAMI